MLSSIDLARSFRRELRKEDPFRRWETQCPTSGTKRKKSLEEEYFRRKEQEAIEELRAERQVSQRESRILTCPKCDGTIVEISFGGVTIDRCNECGGVWLDAGELELLSQKEKEPAGSNRGGRRSLIDRALSTTLC